MLMHTYVSTHMRARTHTHIYAGLNFMSSFCFSLPNARIIGVYVSQHPASYNDFSNAVLMQMIRGSVHSKVNLLEFYNS